MTVIRFQQQTSTRCLSEALGWTLCVTENFKYYATFFQ